MCVHLRACICVRARVYARKEPGRIIRKHEEVGQKTNPHATQFTFAPTNSRRHLSLPSHPAPNKVTPPPHSDYKLPAGFLPSHALRNQQTRSDARMIDFLSYAHNKKITITAPSPSAVQRPQPRYNITTATTTASLRTL